ncbi:histone acetylation protein-domain-containing protein [Schizothecium vesticola]|uniref:histone acetyltransferase n=1 Tax=Schizothecium vesticola TaxID=314040 RepID=A0AA40EL81_9PEZI|nr:histone acetylation protein-domain-containing protein [Schizothecium vesticola]
MSSVAPSASRRDAKGSAGGDTSLLDKLASVLPQGYKFDVHHLSTPPTKTQALCSAPPGEKDDKTYNESHFLAISVDARHDTVAGAKRASPGADGADGAKAAGTRQSVLVFAIEIFIFTTAYQTVFFVSKADSTGYLQLLNLPKGTRSPVREVSAAFLEYLLEHRRRKNMQTVVNLFARAQAQYLFPGSVENKGKHVLDDWGLVRWWCRVLNPLLESPGGRAWANAKGYLIVPGLEEKEMRALTPRTPASADNWVIGHPMERISHYTTEFDWIPLRCLIPRYPDDPKSRFRDELDEEAAKWKEDMGEWKSVKTPDQFWEMMAHRQECSSGRLTGFIWLVFDPKTNEAPPQIPSQQLVTPTSSFDGSGQPATPPRRRVDISGHTPRASPLKLTQTSTPTATAAEEKAKARTKARERKKRLTGLIIPRQPRAKTHQQQRDYIPNRPNTTAYYHWPPQGRGNKIVDETDYKRIVELLLHLDFSTLGKAVSSTRRWISEAAVGGRWGHEIVGRRISALVFGGGSGGSGLFGEKAPATKSVGAVNMLGTGLVRKKAKAEEASAETATVKGGQVNMLGAGLVRKKPKAA